MRSYLKGKLLSHSHENCLLQERCRKNSDFIIFYQNFVITPTYGCIIFAQPLKAFQTILSSLLVTLVLISSISHSVSFHLCGGEIENVALFGHAQACSVHDRGCNKDTKANHDLLHNKGCCEDKTVVIDADKFLSKITEKIVDSSYQKFPLAQIGITQIGNSLDGLVNAHFVKYKPPLIGRDITILVQTFLI